MVAIYEHDSEAEMLINTMAQVRLKLRLLNVQLCETFSTLDSVE